MTVSLLAVDNNTVVSISYTLFHPDGQIIDQSAPGEPMDYLHGHQNIVSGLERHLHGKRVGDMIDVVVPPEEGYGVRVEAGLQRVPRGAFPPDVELEPGDQYATRDDSGEPVPFWVMDVNEEHVVIDLNHPLAGVPLHFKVTVHSIRTATPNEIAHGHAHGDDDTH